MRRALVVLLVLAGVLAAPAAAQSPSFVKDSAMDGRGKLDIVRVALGPRNDGRLRGEVTMEKAWTTADLRTGSGAPGSICLQLYTTRVPGEDPPDFLVCATPAPGSDELRGRVLRGHRHPPHAAHRLPPLRSRRHRPPALSPLRRGGRHACRQVPEAARLPGHRAGRSGNPKSDLA